MRGEISLIFFNGEFSHSVLKKPTGEFKVQGGKVETYNSNEKQVSTAKKIVSICSQIASKLNGEQKTVPLLYARVDFMFSSDLKSLLLSEFEGLDPQLFIKEENSSIKFAEAIMKHL